MGWEFCDGRLVAISENDALFNVIGTTYGGDGESTFALPNLQGRLPVHRGQRPGFAAYVVGEAAGVESVTLTTNQMPSHTHLLTAADVAPRCSSTPGTDRSPANRVFAVESAGVTAFYSSAAPDAAMGGLSGTATVNVTGGSQPHTNMPPYLGLTFIIATFGDFPPL